MRSGPASGSGHLIYALALLAVTGAALLAAGAGERERGTADSAASDPVDPEALAELSDAVIPRVARRVEQIRDLEFDRVPRPRVVSAEFLNELGEREARRTGAARGLAAAESAARLVGLMDAEEDLDSILGSTGDIAAAAYDTRRDRLYVVEDAVTANRGLVEFILAHELVHALEDEHFRLPEREPASDDAALAELALTEGTATATMIEYGRKHIDAADLVPALEGIDGGGGDVPRFVLEQLEWAYLGGAAWVERIYAVTDDWKLVDHAFASRPPASTEQILHPLAYLRDERPRSVPPPADALRQRGWRPADTGVIGELVTEQLLRLDPEGGVAARAVEGWGGDRYRLWMRRGGERRCEPEACRRELAMVIRWHWDSVADARQFEIAAGGYLERGLGGEPTGADSFALDGGAVALARRGATTTIAFAPTQELARLGLR